VAAVLEGAGRVKLQGGLAAMLALSTIVLAQPAPGSLPEEGRYLGRRVPDLAFRDARGQAGSLLAFGRKEPLLLALVFTRCVGVCSPLLASLARAQDALGDSGRVYRTLVLSFDPRDTPADMGELAARLGLREAADWSFAVAAEGDVRRLADTFGFWYSWDADVGQFDHPGMLVALDRGRVVRLLVGPQVEPVRLQEVVRELRGDFVPAYPQPGRVAFRCFQYRADTGELRLDWGFLILLVPGLLAGTATLGLFRAGERWRAVLAPPGPPASGAVPPTDSCHATDTRPTPPSGTNVA
jgi:cytochrome oxidase Cu insertion factor (SCO1/SenC/PrrC family)